MEYLYLEELFVGNSALMFNNKIKNLSFMVSSALSRSEHGNKVVITEYTTLRAVTHILFDTGTIFFL